MIDKIDLNEREVEPIVFDDTEELSEAQKKYEYDLQQAAGIEPSADFAGIRSRLAQQHKDEEDAELYGSMEMLVQSGLSPEEAANTVASYDNIYKNTDIESSLEVEAGRKSVENTLVENQTTRLNALSDPLDFNEEDFAIKNNIANKFNQSLENFINGENTFTKVGKHTLHQQNFLTRFLPEDFQTQLVDAVEMIPGATSAMSSTVGEENFLKELDFDAEDVGTRQKQEYLKHYLNDTPEQFEEYLQSIQDQLDKRSPSASRIYLENVFGNTDISNDIFNLLDLIDAGGTVAGLRHAFKGGSKSAATSAKIMGNTKKANEQVLEAVEKGTDEATILEDAVTVSATQPFQSQGLMSEANKVSSEMKMLLADREAMEYVSAIQESQKLTPSQVELAEAIAKDSVMKDLSSVNNGVVDIQAVSVAPDENGVYRARITIGGGIDDMQGMNKKTAEKLAKDLGLTPDEYSILKKDGQGYYVDVDRVFKEDELIEIGKDVEMEDYLNQDKHSLFEKAMNPIKRTFAGRVQVSDLAHQKDITAMRTSWGLASFLHRRAKKSIKGLDKQGMKDFKDIRKIELNDNVWLEDDDIIERWGKNEALLKTHNEFRIDNDFEAFMQNRALHQKLEPLGYKMFDGLIGRIVDVNRNNFDRIIIKDAETFDKLEKELAKGKKVVEIHRADVTRNRLNYSYKLIDPSATNIQQLPQFIVPYLPGGRRAYMWGTAFVKIGSKFEQAGRAVNGFARTIKAGMNKKELQVFADEINKLSEIYKLNDEVAQAKALTDTDFKYLKVDVEKMNKLYKSDTNPKGFLDADYKAQVLEDGDKYVYNNGLADAYDGTERLSDALEDLVNLRESTFNGRGYWLDDINGDKTKIVDPQKMWEDTITRAVHTGTYKSLYQWYYRNFRKYFEDLVDGGRQMTDMELINAPLRQTSDTARLHAAKAFQQHYQRMSMAKTGLDRTIHNFMQNISRGLGDIVGNRAKFEKLANTDPLAFVRTMEFCRAMWGNLSQLWRQSEDLIATSISHPIDMTRAHLLETPALIGLMAKRHGWTKLEKFIYKHTSLGVDMEKLVDYLDKYGTLESIGAKNPTLYMHYRSSRGLGKNKAVVAAEKAVLSPYTVAQGQVNIVSDITAFLLKGGKDFREIAAKADDLTRNMSQASQSAFRYGQKLGITKTMSQWSDFTTHSIEAVLGGKGLTPTERLSILAVQMMALGGISNFGTEAAVNAYRWLMLNKEQVEELMKEFGIDSYQDFVEQGCFGLMQNFFKDYGIDFRDDIGIDQQIDKIVQAFSTEVDDRGTKFIDMFPSARAIKAYASWLPPVYKVAMSFLRPTHDPLTAVMVCQDYIRQESKLTGVNNACKAYIVNKTGQWLNNKAQEVAYIPLEDRTKWTALTLFGFRPYEAHINELEFYSEKKRKQIIREGYNQINDIVAEIKAYESFRAEDPMEDKKNLDQLFWKFDNERKTIANTLKDDYQFGESTANKFLDDTQRLLSKRWEKAGDKTHKSVEENDPIFARFLTWKREQEIR